MLQIDAIDFLMSLRKAMQSLPRRVMAALQRSTTQAAAYAKVNTLYKSRTGRLRSSIRGSVKSGTYAEVSANAPHARYVEEGTKAHPITPKRRSKRRSMLRFRDSAGDVVFRRSVRHPGTKPRPFMQQARDKTEPIFDRLCREAADRMFD